MIYVERPSETPFDEGTVIELRQKLREHYELGPRMRRQRRPPIEREMQLLRDSARSPLALAFNGKCAYCETPLRYGFEIDNFRPLFGANQLSGEPSPDHYAWLAPEWGNFYPICSGCGRAKKQFFPTRDNRRAEVGTPYDRLSAAERRLLLDPCFDDPELELRFAPDGTVAPESERGDTTIKVLHLNRPDLVKGRLRIWQEAVRAAGFEFGAGGAPRTAEQMALVYRMARPDAAYSAVVRAFIRHFEGGGLPFPASVADDSRRSAAETIETDEEAFRLTARPLRLIEITNFKLIRELALELPEPSSKSSWLMLLGENASGKSTVLQAVALALAGADEARQWLSPRQALSRGQRSGSIRLKFWDSDETVELLFQSDRADFGGARRPSAIVLGYGALRYPERRRRPPNRPVPRFARIGPLLKPTAPVPHPRHWLTQISDESFDIAAHALKSVLPVDDEAFVDRDGRKIWFSVRGHHAPLEELSAGYQTVVGLTVDIIRTLFERWSSLVDATAIVLVDELDAHLHPRWKMRIVRALREALPGVQFIASTHDPLVLRGMKNGEVALLTRHPERGAAADRGLPSVEGLSVDQLLTSRHFGLSSTLDPDVEILFEEYYHLQVQPQTDETRARIRQLKSLLAGKGELGRNRRERLMLEAADNFIAAEDAGLDPDRHVQLRKETVQRLTALWKDSTRGRPGTSEERPAEEGEPSA